MTSNLAIEDIEALIDEGCVVHPSDIIRLNALGLKIEKLPDFRLATLPRIAILGDVIFRQPTIAQDLFMDDAAAVLNNDQGTMLALEAYVLAHPDEVFDKLKHPTMFALKCKAWIKRKLGKYPATEVRRAIDFCLFGVDQRNGEKPVYMTDKDDSKMILPDSPLSKALRLWMQAASLNIDSAAALRATSPQLEAMIERAYLLNERNICDDEKQTTAEYFATLDYIKKKAYEERDAKKDTKKDVKNG